MSEVSGQLKRADLRAFVGSVEGLYPLEGEVRNTGISEGFTGKEWEPVPAEGALYPKEACAQKFAPKFFGGKN